MVFVSGCFLGLRLALRARFLPVSFVFFSLVLIIAGLSAQFSGRQPSSVALDVGVSSIRLFLPFILILIVQELISKDFERRYFLSVLSFPQMRAKFLLSRFCAVTLLSQLLLFFSAAVLAFVVWLLSTEYEQATPVALGVHYLIAVSFMAVDLFVLTALATFLAVTASTPSFVLIGTLGFVMVARSFSSILELLLRNSFVVSNAEGYGAAIGMLGYFLPDLGALDVRQVALYGRMEFLPSGWPWLLLSSLSYAVGMLALAVWALNRKRFF